MGKSKRRENDFYPTPAWATQELLKHVDVKGVVFEPCAGDGAIADVLAESADNLIKSDLDASFGYTKDWHPKDATTERFWAYWAKWDEWTEEEDYRVDWTVTNPPFSNTATILKQAYAHSNVGVAFLLRLSFLEPCNGRVDFLTENPPTKLIVLPRISFTGDGKTDNVTCAWMVWIKPGYEHLAKDNEPIKVIPRRVSNVN